MSYVVAFRPSICIVVVLNISKKKKISHELPNGLYVTEFYQVALTYKFCWSGNLLFIEDGSKATYLKVYLKS